MAAFVLKVFRLVARTYLPAWFKSGDALNCTPAQTVRLSGKFDDACRENLTVGRNGMQCGLLNGGQPMLNSEFHQAGQILEAQFLHQAAAVGFDGLLGERQRARDFGV